MAGDKQSSSSSTATTSSLVSRRNWKTVGENIRASALTASSRKQTSWSDRLRTKEAMQKTKALEKTLQKANMEKRGKQRQRIAEKKKRKQVNELKSSVGDVSSLQLIKDTRKIRKWNKKARDQLVKMSPEMMSQLYGTSITRGL